MIHRSFYAQKPIKVPKEFKFKVNEIIITLKAKGKKRYEERKRIFRRGMNALNRLRLRNT